MPDMPSYWQIAQGLPNTIIAGQTLAISNLDQWATYQDSPYGQHNFALHVGDNPQAVQQQRMQLLNDFAGLGLKRLVWLNQTHSTQVYRVTERVQLSLLDGDGLVTQERGVGLMIMTADCLPIILSSQQGEEVACIHAGWRSLVNGVIESTLLTMRLPVGIAWLGAAISQAHFEVGKEVRAAFLAKSAQFTEDFQDSTTSGKYVANLYAIARKILQQHGVATILGGDQCSFADQRFYSYRRAVQTQHVTGRMATMVFIR